ncbi:MAG: peptidase MA family metallohydrolase, partial [Myxococcota bacterium]|nr:peptidase MA family metallohydrolase [Myxococcota bacterium]
MRTLLAILLTAAMLCCAGSAFSKSHDTRHFRFHLSPGTEQASLMLAEEADQRYAYLCSMLQACDVVKKPIDVYLARDPAAFSAAFPEGSRMSEWAVGVAFIRHNRIVLRAHGSALFSLRETFDHEVSHILVHGLVGDGDLPRWLSEGLAIWQAGESVVQRLASAQRATLSDSLMPLQSLDDRFPAAGGGVSLAYAEAALFVRWLEFHYGPHSL